MLEPKNFPICVSNIGSVYRVDTNFVGNFTRYRKLWEFFSQTSSPDEIWISKKLISRVVHPPPKGVRTPSYLRNASHFGWSYVKIIYTKFHRLTTKCAFIFPNYHTRSCYIIHKFHRIEDTFIIQPFLSFLNSETARAIIKNGWRLIENIFGENMDVFKRNITLASFCCLSHIHHSSLTHDQYAVQSCGLNSATDSTCHVFSLPNRWGKVLFSYTGSFSTFNVIIQK